LRCPFLKENLCLNHCKEKNALPRQEGNPVISRGNKTPFSVEKDSPVPVGQERDLPLYLFRKRKPTNSVRKGKSCLCKRVKLFFPQKGKMTT
jgi:hypothetical protein